MQSVTDLVKLRDSIIARVRHLRRIVAPLLSASTTSYLLPSDKRALAFVVVELDNLIIVGLRQYTKSCLLRSRTASGTRITANVRPTSTEEAAALIYCALKPTSKKKPTILLEKDEEAVRDPKQVEQVLLNYAASNLSNFTLALSLNAEVFSELKICRHFFAHRAKNTFEAVQALATRLAIIGLETPEQFVVQGRPSTGVRLLDGWLADVEIFFDLAT